MALGVAALVVARIVMPGHAANAQQTAAAVAAMPGSAPVVVAAQPIPYGVVLEPKYLTVAKLPAANVPAGAYSSVNQILSQQGGPPTAIVPMQAQEAVLPSKLTGVGERPTIAALITPGMRAYTIAITEVTGIGGHVMPGDRVDVVLTRDVANESTAGLSGQRRLVSSIVGQDLRVLGIDQNANPTTTTPTIARAATLEVSIQDAERLALSAQAGTLSLALRKTGATEIDPVRVMQAADLGPTGPVALRGAVDGEEHHHLRARAAVAHAGDDVGTIHVVNGGGADEAKAAPKSGRVGFP